MALGLAKRIYFSSSYTKSVLDLARAQVAVKSGLSFVIALIEADADLTYDGLTDIYYNAQGDLEKGVIQDGVGFTVQAIKQKQTEWDEETLRYGVDCLNSKLNLNFITKEQTTRIIEIFDVNKEIFAAVLDWIDPDNDPNNNGEGAEKDFYEDMDMDITPRNGPLQSWNELFLIKGMTDEFAKFLRENFTIYGDGRVNINFAEKNTLLMLGFPESLIIKIHRFLRGIDDVEGTEDDNSIKQYEIFMKDLNEYESIYPEELSALQKSLPYINTITTHFGVKVMPIINNNIYPYYLNAVIERKKEGVTVLRSSEMFGT